MTWEICRSSAATNRKGRSAWSPVPGSGRQLRWRRNNAPDELFSRNNRMRQGNTGMSKIIASDRKRISDCPGRFACLREHGFEDSQCALANKTPAHSAFGIKNHRSRQFATVVLATHNAFWIQQHWIVDAPKL